MKTLKSPVEKNLPHFDRGIESFSNIITNRIREDLASRISEILTDDNVEKNSDDFSVASN
ncbi:MAG: hypothetical protein JXR95_08640 [Deltaproteobacteria bacterium]|nr:hypothetical protein [Deltaproteobacteria bacterium]